MRWAACQALGQLCTDLGPGLQEAEHPRILPALIALMGDFSQPRVQAHAAAAVVNFAENCEQARAAPAGGVVCPCRSLWMLLHRAFVRETAPHQKDKCIAPLPVCRALPRDRDIACC